MPRVQNAIAVLAVAAAIAMLGPDARCAANEPSWERAAVGLRRRELTLPVVVNSASGFQRIIECRLAEVLRLELHQLVTCDPPKGAYCRASTGRRFFLFSSPDQRRLVLNPARLPSSGVLLLATSPHRPRL